MTDFLAYILRSGLYMAIFYAFFLLVMRKTTFFRLNRMLLLAGTLVCLVLPIFRVRTEAISIGSGPLSMFFGGQASAKTATEAICNLRKVLMTRTAISPRLAISTLLIFLLFILQL